MIQLYWRLLKREWKYTYKSSRKEWPRKRSFLLFLQEMTRATWDFPAAVKEWKKYQR